MEHFGGGEDRPRDIPEGYEMPGLQEVPTEIPRDEQRKSPEGIEHWPDISDLGEDDPLPGEEPEEKKPPTIH